MGGSSEGYNNLSIPKLVGISNYRQWEVLCKSSLRSCGVWEFVTGSAITQLQDAVENEYPFQVRLEDVRFRLAQARNIILSSCEPHIQQTLADVLTAKKCWDKITEFYGNERLLCINGQKTWAHFVSLKYRGEEITEFCLKYRAALDQCHASGIDIQETLQVHNFINLLDLDARFEHWATNKRERMRRDQDYMPTLDTLINEITDEDLRRKYLAKGV